MGFCRKRRACERCTSFARADFKQARGLQVKHQQFRTHKKFHHVTKIKQKNNERAAGVCKKLCAGGRRPPAGARGAVRTGSY
jgi:hypothetical protein